MEINSGKRILIMEIGIDAEKTGLADLQKNLSVDYTELLTAVLRSAYYSELPFDRVYAIIDQSEITYERFVLAYRSWYETKGTDVISYFSDIFATLEAKLSDHVKINIDVVPGKEWLTVSLQVGHTVH